MKKHTRGPWSTNGKVFNDKSSHIMAGETVVATTWVNAKNNAKLIAAAPDLLIACKAAFEQLQVYGLVTGEGDLMDTLNNTINKAEER